MFLMDQKTLGIIWLAVFTNLHREPFRWPIYLSFLGTFTQNLGTSHLSYLMPFYPWSALRDSDKTNLIKFSWYVISLHPWLSLHMSDHNLQLYIFVIINFCLHTSWRCLLCPSFIFCHPVVSNSWHIVIQIFVEWINDYMNEWMSKWSITKILI